MIRRTYDGETGALIEEVDDGLPEPVPQVVSARQMKLALLGVGMLDHIESFVATQDRGVQISWEYATEFHRNDAMLAGMAQAFGLTGDQVDDIFRTAAGF